MVFANQKPTFEEELNSNFTLSESVDTAAGFLMDPFNPIAFNKDNLKVMMALVRNKKNDIVANAKIRRVELNEKFKFEKKFKIDEKQILNTVFQRFAERITQNFLMANDPHYTEKDIYPLQDTTMESINNIITSAKSMKEFQDPIKFAEKYNAVLDAVTENEGLSKYPNNIFKTPSEKMQNAAIQTSRTEAVAKKAEARHINVSVYTYKR